MEDRRVVHNVRDIDESNFVSQSKVIKVRLVRKVEEKGGDVPANAELKAIFVDVAMFEAAKANQNINPHESIHKITIIFKHNWAVYMLKRLTSSDHLFIQRPVLRKSTHYSNDSIYVLIIDEQYDQNNVKVEYAGFKDRLLNRNNLILTSSNIGRYTYELFTNRSISQYTYTPLSDLYCTDGVNVYGSIVRVDPIKNTNGSDLHYRFYIQDPHLNNHPITVVQFDRRERIGYGHMNVKDIVRIHRCKVQIYKNEHQLLLNKRRTSYCVYDGNNRSTIPKWSTSANISPVDEEILEYFRNNNTTTLFSNRYRKKISEISCFDKFCDLYAKVIRVTHEPERILYVWDGTDNNDLNYAIPCIDNDLSAGFTSTPKFGSIIALTYSDNAKVSLKADYVNKWFKFQNLSIFAPDNLVKIGFIQNSQMHPLQHTDQLILQLKYEYGQRLNNANVTTSATNISNQFAPQSIHNNNNSISRNIGTSNIPTTSTPQGLIMANNATNVNTSSVPQGLIMADNNNTNTAISSSNNNTNIATQSFIASNQPQEELKQNKKRKILPKERLYCTKTSSKAKYPLHSVRDYKYVGKVFPIKAKIISYKSEFVAYCPSCDKYNDKDYDECELCGDPDVEDAIVALLYIVDHSITKTPMSIIIDHNEMKNLFGENLYNKTIEDKELMNIKKYFDEAVTNQQILSCKIYAYEITKTNIEQTTFNSEHILPTNKVSTYRQYRLCDTKWIS